MIRAIIIGVVLGAIGTLPWAFLVSINYKHYPSIPWAVPPTLLYLLFYWKYVRGKGFPSSTSETRRINVRANSLSDEVWGSALLAGSFGLGAVVLLLRVLNRLVILPHQQLPDLSHIPTLTLLCFLLTGSAVAGVVEETAFRGYMQKPIEQNHGPVIAILVSGTLFGFAHFTHPEVTIILLPYYLAIAAVYGMLAYITNSILPSMVLHTGGNILSGMDLFTRGQSEWQASSTPPLLIWQAGTDAEFRVSVMLVLAVGAAAVWAYMMLANTVRNTEAIGNSKQA